MEDQTQNYNININYRIFNMTFLKDKYKYVLVFGFFILVGIVTIVCSGYYAKEELREKIDFVVFKIHITPALRCNLYDKFGNELELNSYTFYDSSGFKVGDSIVKNSNSPTIVCYRQNSSGQYKIVQKFQPD
jgi:hypothetical protein